MNRTLLAWGPAVAWAAVLFLLSEWSALPRSTWAAENDKVVHVVLYTILGAALAWGRRHSAGTPPHWSLLLVGYGYGAVDEWHQSYVPRRQPSAGDLSADVIGVTLGYVLVAGIAALGTGPGRRAGPPSRSHGDDRDGGEAGT